MRNIKFVSDLIFRNKLNKNKKEPATVKTIIENISATTSSLLVHCFDT